MIRIIIIRVIRYLHDKIKINDHKARAMANFASQNATPCEHLLANDDRASLHGTSLSSLQIVIIVFTKLASLAIALAWYIIKIFV